MIEHSTTFRSAAWLLERGATAALTLLAAIFAFEAIRPVASVGGLALTTVEAVLVLALGLWLLACLAGRRRPRVPRGVAAAAAAWLAVLLLSALLAPDHRLDAVKFVGRMAAGVLAAWAAYDLVCVTGRWQAPARALALGGLAVAILGLAEAANVAFVARFLAGFKTGRTVVGEVLRVSSTLGYATIASMVLELTVPLLLAWVLTARRGWTRVLLAAGLVAMLAAQVLTLTRGGMIALVAALGFMGAWAARHRQRAFVAGSLVSGGAVLVFAAVVLVWNPVARYRLVSETEQQWYRAGYEAPAALEAGAGETLAVPLTLVNTGVRGWQLSGEHPFLLSYHLARPDGTQLEFEGPRTPLPHDVEPGATVLVEARVRVPAVAGEYVVEWDMVQEDVTWFSWKGTAPAQTRLSVSGAATAAAAQPAPAGAAAPTTIPPPAESEGRLWLWQVAARMGARRPLLGVGPDNFRWLHGAYAGLASSDTRVHANNLYIEWLVDTGIVGLAAFAWLAWQLAAAAHRGLSGPRASKEQAIWHLALVGSLVAWFVHGLLDFFYEFTPTYVAFSLIGGLVLATSVLSEKGPPCASDST